MTTRRTVTPAEYARMTRGSERIAPGIWVDADRNLHFSVAELLTLFGWPDDAEHRAMVIKVCRDVAAAHFPDVAINEIDAIES